MFIAYNSAMAYKNILVALSQEQVSLQIQLFEKLLALPVQMSSSQIASILGKEWCKLLDVAG
jgi:hypothetical protein